MGIQSLDAVYESVERSMRGSLSSLGQGRREKSCFAHGVFLILAKSIGEPLKPKGGIPEAKFTHPQGWSSRVDLNQQVFRSGCFSSCTRQTRGL